MLRGICSLLFLTVTTSVAYSQPQICQDPIEMVPFCNEACIICDIDGYEGRHDSNVRGEAPPDFCVFGVENAQWIAFLAGSEELRVEISVSNCDNFFLFSGLQMSIYESQDCETFQRVSNCIGGLFQVRQGQTGTLFMNDLTIGQYYYLVMDGAAGDNCDWRMDVVLGTTDIEPLDTTGTIVIEDSYCANDTVRVALHEEAGVAQYVWKLGTDTVSTAASWDSVFAPGIYEVCVVGSNACNTGPQVCDTIWVEPLIRDTVTVELCDGECILVGDSLLCASGVYLITVPSETSCDTSRLVQVVAAPAIALNEEVTICPGDCVEVYDTTICESGIYPIDRTGVDGSCDTTIILQVSTGANIPIAVAVDLCPEECYAVSDTLICQAGLYQVRRSSTTGCDTVYTVSLTALDSVFELRDTLVCPGATVVLDGTQLNAGQVYTQIRLASNGCDSTIRWSVIEQEIDTLTESLSICKGDTILLGGQVIVGQGQYLYQQFGGADRCSIPTLVDVSEIVVDTTRLSTLYCGSPVVVGDTVVNGPVDLLLTRLSLDGCDSVVVIEVDVGQIDTVIPDIEYYCEGDSLLVDGRIVLRDTFITVISSRLGACDSVTLRKLEFVDCNIGLGRNIIPIDCRGNQTASIDFSIFNGLMPYELLGSRDGISFFREDLRTTSLYTLDGLEPGNYVFVVTDRLGNSDTRAITIIEPMEVDLALSLSDYNGYGISCVGADDGSVSLTVLQANGTTEVELNGQPYVTPLAGLPSGTYDVTVVDELGCQTDTIFALAPPPLPTVELSVNPLPCSADTAAFVLGSTFSQLPIATVMYNGEESAQIGTWEVPQDMQGLQVISITDVNGCSASDSVMVDVPGPFTLDLVDTLFLSPGDSISLLMEWSDSIASVIWQGSSLSCDACLTPSIRVPGNSIVTVEVTDLLGCARSYLFVVNVEETPPIMLANIFSPNGDGINDVWTVDHPAIGTLIDLHVYDRWGNLVFEGESKDSIWNGRFGGDDVAAGVYIYSLRYRDFTRDREVSKSGTITLVR